MGEIKQFPLNNKNQDCLLKILPEQLLRAKCVGGIALNVGAMLGGSIDLLKQ